MNILSGVGQGEGKTPSCLHISASFFTNNTKSFSKTLLFQPTEMSTGLIHEKRIISRIKREPLSDFHVGICCCPFSNFPLFSVIFMELAK